MSESQALDQELVKSLFKKGYRSPVFFCRFFLQRWFPGPMPWLHRGLLAILTRRTDFLLDFGQEVWTTKKGREILFEWTPEMLDKLIRHFTYPTDPTDDKSAQLPIFSVERDDTGAPIAVHMAVTRNTLIMIPRGFSKTTLTNAAVLWRVVYQESLFPCYVGETQTHAERQLGNVKLQLETNERLIAVFGSLKPEQRAGLQWTQDIIQTITGITIAARGRGGQVRGLNVNAQRPDWIVVDDVEDKESVATHEQRKKTEDWFMGDLLPASGEMDEEEGESDTEVSLIMLATLLHTEALAQKNRQSPDFTSLVFGALDLDGEPLWGAKMGLKKIENKKTEYARRGKLALFYLEFFNQIRADEEQKFRSDFFIHRTYLISETTHRALMIDPAISEKKGSDFCAFGVVGMSERGQLVVYHADGKVGMSPREQVNEYFRLAKLYKPTKYGVETIAYQAALVHLLREEMFREKLYFEIQKIGHHSQNKIERITGILQPRYAAGYIHHVRSFPLLETQLQDFPNSKVDVPDVVAMAVALLDPFAAQAGGAGLDEDEYDPQDLGWCAAP